jgi:hypothetical protein
MTFKHDSPLFLLCASLFLGCGYSEDAPEELTGSTGSTGSTESALSLPGSRFEIDSNANLVVDTPGNLDWANVADSKKSDLPTGQSDDSYGGGAKEDDPCPPVDTGNIPNNKSDLKSFGVYQEPGSGPGDPGYLHVFWTRVQDPTGTTLMEFEFNQASARCSNGVNPVRTQGDFLLEYRIEQGGATATLKLRTWNGAAWGAAADLTGATAVGDINDTAITAANSDGNGALAPRTFGEASIDLDFIFSSNRCVSFGSAFVKSRASDAFNSALKDFIAPTPVSISNCGRVVIRKQTDPDGLTAPLFPFTHTIQTIPPQAGTTFQLADNGLKEFTNARLGNGYTVTEAPTPGFTLASIDCGASSGVTPAVNLAAGTIKFDLDNPNDVVDCTYTNRGRGTIVIEKQTIDGSGTFGFTSPTLGAFGLTTTGPGAGGKASKTFADRAPGTYAVAEAAPAGWNLISATCSDGSSPGAISLSAGETVTCTFVNQRKRGAIQIVKTRKHAAAGAGAHPHAGVMFAVSGGGLAAPISVVTNANGIACVDGLLLSSLAGSYTVTEVVPAGYAVESGLASKLVAVTTDASCSSGIFADRISFSNVPLSTLTVAVDSIVPGGTASKISCTGLAMVATDPVTGDGSATLSAVRPGTYTCTIVVDP